MDNTIQDLYLKYVGSVGEALEDDRYFQYLFEMVQAGDNTFHQTNQVLHKVVDERWLTTIEESLDAINEIIDKPRRFITTSEEVVPVALAKKITADSVRHLSMNTQFIASDEDGDIQPTRILNVSVEESYDMYENRFVYHLIQKLVTFIDKRTDVIFWSTGDEVRNNLKLESKVDDAYEEIEYKIEMKIKKRQSFVENDSDNMHIFMRIDRVRRLVMALRNSSFCSLMQGCSVVRSPIQRTNLLMKDPNYRTCYKLWQFLESYDEVGYTIEERDSALEFDEEYMIQMYTNLITNYTVFKSLIEGDERNLEEVAVEKKEPVHPKFVKQIQEEFVDNCDIPDVEIRKVFVEEVTQAQLDAEEKLRQETELRMAAEEERESVQLQLENERWQMQMQLLDVQEEAEGQIEQMRQEAESQVNEAKEMAEAARLKANMQITEAKQLAEAKIAEAKENAENEIARANRHIEESRAAAEAEIAEVNRRMEEHRAAADSEIAEANRQMEAHRAAAETEIRRVKKASKAKIIEIKESSAAEIEETRKQTRQEIEETRKQTQLEIEETRKQTQLEIEETRKQTQLEIEEARSQAKMEIEEMRRQAQLEIEEMRRQAEQMVNEAKQAEAEALRREQDALKNMEKEIKARKKAEARADEKRLSNRLMDAWFGRRAEKDQDKEDGGPDDQQ
ncbi:MAG: hypothetical protein SO181_03535 [Frisingicoccus sp.]|uniref:hypothetical protein n=1 Tax=Frisingicoccus sp. TaxID=1918627 RepID=UPI002A841546|nr:hypothetical protein [Frisingicoccus sp.]MDY4834206.1 hypothetical protein [Frisingicoccus sp.]